MASIVLLLSELLGGESASVLAANRYIGGHRSLVGEFRQAVTTAASASARQDGRARAAAAVTEQQGREEIRSNVDSFEDLAVSRIAVDVMWP